MQSSPELCDVPALSWGRRTYAHPGKHLGSGNRCGHKPDTFAADRLDLPEVEGGFRPRALSRLMARAVALFDDPDLMHAFTHHKGKRNKDGSKRLVRSESREAVGLVLHAIASCLDLVSLRVGTYLKDGRFRNYSALDLAERCNMVRVGKDPDQPGKLKRFPSARFWRALKWLQDFGAVTLFEQYEEKAGGEKRGRPAIKTVNEKFLRRLGAFTGGVWKKFRALAYSRTAKFLANARNFGIQTVQEADDLDRGLEIDVMLREVFGDKHKNAKPKGNKTVKVVIHREQAIDYDALRTEWDAYAAKLTKDIEGKLGRTLRGAEQVTLFAKAGGKSFHQWLVAKGLKAP